MRQDSAAHGFDAIVLASGACADRIVCGLSLAERGRRVASRAGADRILTLDGAHSGDRLAAWSAETNDKALLVLDASDHVVHLPLVEAVRPDTDISRPAARIAVDPDDPNSYAGAIWVPAAQRGEAMAALREDPTDGDAKLARKWLAEGAGQAQTHGDIARHPARSRDDRREATRMLFRLVNKPSDTGLVRTVNRRVSYPLTRMLLPTPITPNLITTFVLLVGALGCWFVAQPGYWSPVIGTLIVLLANYLDGSDGEVARLRLESSRLGAWLDTIADESTTAMFVAAAGIHVYQEHASSWLAWSVVASFAAALISIYVIYYYLIVVAKSCNSQEYPTSSEGFLASIRRVVQRDFINLASVFFAVAGQVELLYLGLATGAIVSALVLIPQHIQLRLDLRRQAVIPVTDRRSAAAATTTHPHNSSRG